MGKYQLAVFDVDGTILDTTEGVLSAVKYTIEKLGLPMLSDQRLSSFIGPPIQDSFARAYGLEGDILQEIAAIFRNRYKDVDLLKARPYDGIYDVFDGLLTLKVMPSVATYKRQDYAVELLQHFGFDRYTRILYGGDHENKLKKRDIIEKCIADSGVIEPSRVVMIGDTIHDAVGAQQIGIDFIGVTYGFGFRSSADLAETQMVGYVDRAIDLLHFFE